ncbi:MAG: hypothetical protein ACK5V5_08495 [Cyclobacteriaceae bacterium]|jgi:hypothetical protein|nr:hypothetical protein [Flammeovirgaceae bacterium]
MKNYILHIVWFIHKGMKCPKGIRLKENGVLFSGCYFSKVKRVATQLIKLLPDHGRYVIALQQIRESLMFLYRVAVGVKSVGQYSFHKFRLRQAGPTHGIRLGQERWRGRRPRLQTRFQQP